MSISSKDDLVLALGKRWREAYDNWEAAPREGESEEETRAMENHADDLGEIAWELQAEIAMVPAFSIEAILVKLRIAGTHHQLMDRNKRRVGRYLRTANLAGLDRP